MEALLRQIGSELQEYSQYCVRLALSLVDRLVGVLTAKGGGIEVGVNVYMATACFIIAAKYLANIDISLSAISNGVLHGPKRKTKILKNAE
eukprot:336252-Rhodomonas_salina.1